MDGRVVSYLHLSEMICEEGQDGLLLLYSV